MGVHESSAILSRAFKDLTNQWNMTKMTWRDANSENFERTYLLPLASDIKQAQSAMDTMSILLHQIHRDCE